MVRFFQVWFVTICEKSIGLLKPCELNTAEIATTANWWCCGDIALENHVILYPKYIVELRTTTTFTEESLCYLDAKMSKTGLRFQARNSKLNTETLISFHFITQNARQWKATCKIVKYLLNARWGLVTEGPRRAVRDNSFFFASSGVGGVHPPVFSLGRRMMDSEQASREVMWMFQSRLYEEADQLSRHRLVWNIRKSLFKQQGGTENKGKGHWGKFIKVLQKDPDYHT